MTAVAHWYGKGMEHCLSDVNLASDTIKAALITNAYTPAQGTDEFFSTAQAHEASGSGYTAGGSAVTLSLSYNSSTFKTSLTISGPVEWNPATVSGEYIVFYKSTGTSSTSPLIGWQDASSTITATAGAWEFTSDASGIFSVTPS